MHYHLFTQKFVVVVFIVAILLLLVYRQVRAPYLSHESYTQRNVDRTKHPTRTPLAVFKARQEHLKHVCLLEGQTPPNTLSESKILDRSLVEVQHTLIYCPIEKVGSSFWRKTISALQSGGRYNNPYGVRINSDNKLIHYVQFRKLTPKHLHDWFLQHATSLMVVRDPYTKLLSGYVDKIYHPNSMFWSYTGTNINEIIRNKSASDDRISCANDITFSDFISYINYMMTNNRENEVNSHFTSMHSHCDPCKVKYDYISKLETFKDDAYHIIDEWNQQFDTKLTFKDFEKDSAKMIATKHIKLSFRAYENYGEKCNLPKEMFLRRTWQFLQISGQIPKSVKMPLSDPTSIERVTGEGFYNIVTKVINHVTDWAEVKKQRHEALIQAYHSVSDTNLNVLRKIVKKDCDYFGYDNQPKDLFEKDGRTFDFKYFDWV